MTTLYDLVVDPYEPAETHAIRTVSYLLSLGDGELQVLSLIAERLARGRETYGPLNIHGDYRDWRVELGYEAADALVYAAAEALRRAPEKRRETVASTDPGPLRDAWRCEECAHRLYEFICPSPNCRCGNACHVGAAKPSRSACSRCADTGTEYLGSGRDYCGCSLGQERREQDERRELNRIGGRS